jgi:glycosyltransferase involved in cell wall biosynthesis
MKIKIINIIQHCPPYAWYRENKPEIHWDIAPGKWVGIWNKDIAAQIGAAVLERSDEFVYEVWQPDHHASRIYEHTFQNGVKHIHFPAVFFSKRYGLKKINQISSPLLLRHLKNECAYNIIIHLNEIFDFISKEVLRLFPDTPKVINFHSRISTIPSVQMIRFRKNILANLYYIELHNLLKKNKKVYFTYNNSTNIERFNKYPKVGIIRSFTAIDFDKVNVKDKDSSKILLGIQPETFVFTMSSRFYPIKQIDKVIDVLILINLKHNFNFMLLITGHGEEKYESYLKEKAIPLMKDGKAKFTGYITGNDLENVYNATDLFISAALSEGGPTSVIKAIAHSVPVFITKVGGIDDYFIENKIDQVFDSHNYNEWELFFIGVLEGTKKLKTFNVEYAKSLFDWNKTASDYIKIYSLLYSLYEKENISH